MALYLTWQPWFGAVLLTSIGINFMFGKWLRAKPHWLPLSLGIAFNLALLGVFKYVPQTTARIFPAALEEVGRTALPPGISFWTFQAMSYLFDLYREQDLDATFAEFALLHGVFPSQHLRSVCLARNIRSSFPHFKPHLLIAVLAAGYGIVMLVGDALSRDASEAIRERSGIVGMIARLRWFWLPAVYALALLVVLLITRTQQGGIGQMLYRSF